MACFNYFIPMWGGCHYVDKATEELLNELLESELEEEELGLIRLEDAEPNTQYTMVSTPRSENKVSILFVGMTGDDSCVVKILHTTSLGCITWEAGKLIELDKLSLIGWRLRELPF